VKRVGWDFFGWDYIRIGGPNVKPGASFTAAGAPRRRVDKRLRL
jgi:hypothetical protein